MEPIKNPVGRPRKKIEDLDPNWRQIIHDEGQAGHGITGFKVKLGLSSEGFASLMEHVEFSDVVYEGLLLCQYWWEQAGINLAVAGKGSSGVWQSNMANRFGWRANKSADSNVVNQSILPPAKQPAQSQAPITKEDLIAELKERGLPISIFGTSDND